MRNMIFKTSFVFTALGLSLAAQAGDSAQWSYSGRTAPAHWGELSSEFAVCESGRNQSPVDLAGAMETDLSELEPDYPAAGRDIVNNGHTVKISYPQQNSLTVDGKTFTLKQVHFHTPSEHTVGGKQYPMEAHLVHADSTGELAVVSVLFERGDAHDALADAQASIPAEAGDKTTLRHGLNAEALLPAESGYYRLNGSLTTPPCSEGVRWLVMQQPAEASADQIDALAKAIGHANNRPVQPLNARVLID